MDEFPRNFDQKEHFVEFYETDSDLLRLIKAYANDDSNIVLIAGPKRLELIRNNLNSSLKKRILLIDAEKVLSELIVEGSPDKEKFYEFVKNNIKPLGKEVKIFGEMVSILWGDGNKDAAIHLEELCSELADKEKFTIFCAYPTKYFEENISIESMLEINGIIEQHKWASLR